MSKIQTISTTLETRQDIPVKDVLQEKCVATSPAQTVDYVAFALDRIETEKDLIKQVINEYKNAIAMLDDKAERIKAGTAEWFQDNGIDKLEGDRISSITISAGRVKEDLIIHDEESAKQLGYTKTVLDKTALKNGIKIGDVPSEVAEIKVTHEQDTVRINRRRR